jgi:nitrite reductase (cytochrome c-552)
MSNLGENVKRSPSFGWLILLVVMAVVFVLGLLAAGITERRAEIAFVTKTPVKSGTPVMIPSDEPSKEHEKLKVKIAKTDPPIIGRSDMWGESYPRQYDTWKKTQETDFHSKYLGNNQEDVLVARPNMVILWAGYAFSRDYSAPRGHRYTQHAMRKSLRTASPGVPGADGKPMPDLQPGTCWTCKSPDVPRMIQEIGPGKYYGSKWSEMGPEIVNPLGCADCHDPKNMNLTITRPALVEAFKRMDANPAVKAKVKQYISFGGDVTKASPNEMRSLVCAQCHVEYYFAEGDNKYLTFPWDNGLTMEDMEKYYDQEIFTDNKVIYRDWTHALSKAPMLKSQHPDWELFVLGTHGKRGVSCADCHMPYKVEGGVKYTDHQIMSPLKNIAGTCQNCHRDSEEKLRGYVEDHQDRLLEIRNRVEDELAQAHIMTKVLLDSGKVTADSAEIKPVHKLLREAGWRWDYGVASHGAGLHAPVETARLLAVALDKSLLAQIEVQKLLTAHGVQFAMPDISDKAKAQAYIGLNMEKLVADKAEFMKTIVPAWIEKAKAEGKLTQPELVNEYNNYSFEQDRQRGIAGGEAAKKWTGSKFSR